MKGSHREDAGTSHLQVMRKWLDRDTKGYSKQKLDTSDRQMDRQTGGGIRRSKGNENAH